MTNDEVETTQRVEGFNPRPSTLRNRLLRLATAALMCLGIYILAWQFLYTIKGQNFDALTRYATSRGKRLFFGVDSIALETISFGALLAVTGVVVLIAAVRHRWQLGARVLVLVAGANLTTQVLKHFVLSRPDLGVDYAGLANSLPSGHTTVAMTAAVGLVMVAPTQARNLATFFAWFTASFVGIAVILNQWHRLGDVLTALLVVGAWAVLLTPRETAARRLGRSFRIGLWGSIGTFLLGFGAAWLAWNKVPDAPLREGSLQDMAFTAPGVFAAAASVLLIIGFSGLTLSLVNTQTRS